MSDNKKNCFINRIKLLNFHNFSNVTIDIKNGGHLFLLGDNGSGKTTVLDAIHYVLTAGEHMEFNAAARISGNKQQGRRPQGVITRYNVDTGHMRPSGGVTYAALEIINSSGKLTTAAIGMSVNSPQDSLTRWGIIKDCPLEEIPFTITEQDGERPLDKNEMKKALDGIGYFGQPSSFCNLLATRFLGGPSKFNDFCRFLSMGKAYREIAAQTTDYQALFMRLLPESDHDIFHRIIDALRTIDESRGDLDKLQDRLSYVQKLLALITEIEDSNCKAAVFDAVKILIKINHVEQSITENQGKIKKWKSDSKQIDKDLIKLEKNKDYSLNKFEGLKSKDASGALQEEENLRKEIVLLTKEYEGDDIDLKQQRDLLRETREEYNGTLCQLRDKLAEIMKQLPEKSLKTGIETGPVITVIEKFLHGEMVQDNNLEEIFNRLLDNTRKEISLKKSNLAVRENSLEKQKEREAETEQEENSLQKSKEATPEWNGFEQLCIELDRSGIIYSPVYKGLEWNSDLTDEMKSRIEEFIGEELLSIITVHADEYDHAAEIIFDDFPGHRLAVTNLHSESPANFRVWAKDIFDINKSNSMILDILLRELTDRKLPDFTQWKNTDIVRFRTHSQSFSGRDARFIGADSREKEQKRKLQNIREELGEIRKVVKEVEKKCKDVEYQERLLINLAKLIDNGLKELRKKGSLAKELNLKVEYIEDKLKQQENNFSQLNDKIKSKLSHCELLRKLIRKNDLESVKNAMDKLEGEVNSFQEEIAEQNKTITKLTIRSEDAEKEIIKSEEKLSEQNVLYSDQLALLADKYGQLNPKESVEAFRVSKRLHVEDDAAQKADKCRMDVVGQKTTLKYQVNEVIGINYGFSYDQENNQLFSRDGIRAIAIEETLRKNYEEQQSLINEKTVELFKKLIMDNMLRTLFEKVHRLEEMQRDINRLLKGRSFGNNSYKIKIKPREEYEHLVKLVKSFTSSSEAMNIFFQDHKDELINTPPGTIPKILDYRNWYRYEMCVYGSNDEGIVMDSRVKSIGSGGEQAVPNYLLVLTIAHFMFTGSKIKLNTLLFDEAFYGIDAQRRDQLMGLASDLGLQLFVASPDQDGAKEEIAFSTSLLVVKDEDYEVHLRPYHWERLKTPDLFKPQSADIEKIEFSEEL